MNKKWTDEQREAIRKYYPDGNYDELFKYFPPGTTKIQICCLASNMGVKSNNPGHRVDLTGQKFGRLTVICVDHVDSNHRVYWRCRCSCGNECVASRNNLSRGWKKSCGCMTHEPQTTLNFVGMRFGRLVAVEQLRNYRGDGGIYYRCRCDCGRETVALQRDLKVGATKSCGCYQKELLTINCERGRTVAGNDYNLNLPAIRRARERKLKSNNTSGVTGVSWNAAKQKYSAYITFRKKRYRLGNYDLFEDAVSARRRAEQLVWMEGLENLMEEWKNDDEVVLSDEERRFRQSVKELLELPEPVDG